MICLRNISVDTLHKGDTEYNNNNHNHNNNKLVKNMKLSTVHHSAHDKPLMDGRRAVNYKYIRNKKDDLFDVDPGFGHLFS
jgi:hypothetical protein